MHAVQVTVGLILIANIFSSMGHLLEVVAEAAAKHTRRVSDRVSRRLSGQQSPGQHSPGQQDRVEVIGREDGADGNRDTPRPVPENEASSVEVVDLDNAAADHLPNVVSCAVESLDGDKLEH